MMWTPVMADEMTDAGCGWPYEPFDVDLSGGQDDPALNGVFEARHYAQLWDGIGAAGLGLCSVGAETEATEQTPEGRVFGFLYQLSAPGCPDADPTGLLRVDEFGTEAQRDAAALSSAERSTTYVLGRWVISLDGVGEDVGPALASLGAQRVP
jgi:hypothetical protein